MHTRKILVADDMTIVRSVCRNALEKRGFDVLEASDGSVALQLFERNMDDIVFSLIDIKMPGIAGVDLVREMLKLKPGAMFAVMSGADVHNAVPADLAAQCGTLDKPFTAHTLRDLVERRIGKTATAGGSGI